MAAGRYHGGIFAPMKLFSAFLLLATHCLGADIYFAQTSAGGNSGADCADAYAYNDATHGLGTAGAWTAGNTLHLCGTFSGTTAISWITAQGSGSSGNVITLKFETGASLQQYYCASEYGCINISSQSYIMIDGGTNGFIENTQNGSPGGACPSTCNYQQNSRAIYSAACNNCEIKNLIIENIYVHTECEAASGCDVTNGINAGTNAIVFGGSNQIIHDNVIHDVGWPLYEQAANGDSASIYNNQIYNMDHGVACGAGANVTVNPLLIYNNHFHDMASWDTGTADEFHHDGVHCFSTLSPVGKIQNLYLYNNLFDGNQGNCCVTAWVFLEGGNSGGSTPWTDSTGTLYAWNNVILGSNDLGNGQLSVGVGTGHEIFNNTIQGTNAGNNGACLLFDTSATDVIVENNALQGCNQLLANGNPAPTSFTTIDYNAYGGTVTGGNPVFNFASYNANTLAAWQSSCSCDAHSVASLGTNFALTSEGLVQTGYIGIGVGANLSSYATGNLATLASTSTGGGTQGAVSRVVPWTIGAYNLVAGYIGSSTGGGFAGRGLTIQ
jgi:hypothetical protein